MSCDSRLYLPPSTQIDDFADILAILLGVRPEMEDSNGIQHCEVAHGLSWKSHATTPTMLTLEGQANGHDVYGRWHWEGFSSPIAGARLFACVSAAPRRRTLERLADVFGGILDFDDCDNSGVDFIGSLSDKPYRPDATDDNGWDAWQRAKMELADESAGYGW